MMALESPRTCQVVPRKSFVKSCSRSSKPATWKLQSTVTLPKPTFWMLLSIWPQANSGQTGSQTTILSTYIRALTTLRPLWNSYQLWYLDAYQPHHVMNLNSTKSNLTMMQHSSSVVSKNAYSSLEIKVRGNDKGNRRSFGSIRHTTQVYWQI